MSKFAELTVTEAVRYSGYTRFYIYILITQGKIVARKINTRASPLYVIDRASLDTYMATSRKHKKREPVNVEE